MVQYFIRFSEFAEFTEFNESSDQFRKNAIEYAGEISSTSISNGITLTSGHFYAHTQSFAPYLDHRKDALRGKSHVHEAG